MTTATRRKTAGPMFPSMSKAANMAAARLRPHAVEGSIRCEKTGLIQETVYARIGGHRIEVSVQSGRMNSFQTCPAHLHNDSRSDYFPQTWHKTLASAIACCLPTERATCRGVDGMPGYLTVEIHREGVSLKPVAYIYLYIEKHPTRYGAATIRKQKAGTAVALCQAFVAAGGQDIACTSALLDHLEESNEYAAAYLNEARNPPPRQPAWAMPEMTF